MKTNATSVRRHGLLPLFVAVFASLSAQSAAPTGGTPPESGDEQRFVLSPFLVNSDRDNGYQAASTLAGTRLNTPIKDLSASISIYTKDFLNDIGATSSSDLLVYATGMEAAGLGGGNFSGATNDIHQDRPGNDAVRTDPQSSSRTRGLAAPTYTRGYFPTSITFDTYNTSVVTVNRGPNAVLFGVGSAAGVVDTALAIADLRNNKNKVQVRFGNNNSIRESVDFNRVLAPQKVAVRLALLNDLEHFNQRPSFEHKKRIYGALTLQPFNSTLVRGNFESGNTSANRPITSLPFNDVSDQWLADGRPSYDWTFFDDPARNPNARTQSAAPPGFVIGSPTGGIAGPMVLYYNPSDTKPSNAFFFRGVATTTATFAANSLATQIFHPLLNRDLANDTATFVASRNVWELPAAYWTGANLPPGQQPGVVPPGVKAQMFRDFSAFDFKNRMIDETSRQGESFRTFNVALSQTAWQNRVGIDLAYDQQYAERNSKNSFFGSASTTNYIMIDVNVALPTGEPNPNLGRPFALSGRLSWARSFEKREAQRATGFFKYDFKELGDAWGRWAGRHTLTGIFENSGATKIAYTNRLGIDGPLSDSIAGNILNGSRRPVIITYLGPSIIGNNNPLKLAAITGPSIQPGPIGTSMAYFVREANQTDPGHFEGTPANFVEIQNDGGGTAVREVIKSQAAALQSYWLQDLIITTFGWRRDSDHLVRIPFGYVENPKDRNDPGKVHYSFSDFSLPRTPPLSVREDITSYGVVLAWPRRLLRPPTGTDLRVFYNESANFTPAGGRVNPLGEPLGSPRGKTREYGLNFSAFSDRLTLRVNWFETGINAASYAPGFWSAAMNRPAQRAVEWATEGNDNPQLAALRNADIELLFSTLPANYRKLREFTVTGTTPRISASAGNNPPGSTDTTDYTAKGTEIDLVFNPTSNWRILANIARQETVQTNALPFAKRFFALMKPVYDKLSHTPVSHYPTDFQPGDTLPANIQTLGQYLDINDFVPFASAIATEGSASAEQRKWRANLVANYTFGRGSIFGERLKGWRVGGAVRWQDKLGLGYPSSRDPNLTVHFDLAHPYFAPPETNIDAWLGYERTLSKRIKWRVRLNARNVYSTGPDLIGASIQSWNGTVASYRLAPERRWYLDNTFDF